MRAGRRAGPGWSRRPRADRLARRTAEPELRLPKVMRLPGETAVGQSRFHGDGSRARAGGSRKLYDTRRKDSSIRSRSTRLRPRKAG